MVVLKVDQLEPHRPLIRRVCLSLLRNESDAEDATQDTFARALSRVDQYRGQASVSTWLCSIAQSICLNLLKKNGRQAVVENLDCVAETASLGATDPMEPADRVLYLHHLLDEIFSAAHNHDPAWDDLDFLIFEAFFHPSKPSWPQIGRILTLSPDTAKYRYYRHILPVLQAVGKDLHQE